VLTVRVVHVEAERLAALTVREQVIDQITEALRLCVGRDQENRERRSGLTRALAWLGYGLR
jgi:hypothetical protein